VVRGCVSQSVMGKNSLSVEIHVLSGSILVAGDASVQGEQNRVVASSLLRTSTGVAPGQKKAQKRASHSNDKVAVAILTRYSVPIR